MTVSYEVIWVLKKYISPSSTTTGRISWPDDCRQHSKHTCILQQIFKTITHFVVDRLAPGGHDAVGDEPPVVVGGPPPPHRRQHVGADGRVVDVRGSAAAA